MRASESIKFGDLLIAEFSKYKNPEIVAAEKINIWFAELEAFKLEDIAYALMHHRNTTKGFTPSTDEIKKIISQKKTNAPTPEKKSSMCDMYLLDGSHCRKETNFAVGRYNVCEDCYEERREKTDVDIMLASSMKKLEDDWKQSGSELSFGMWCRGGFSKTKYASLIGNPLPARRPRIRVESSLEEMRAVDEELVKHYNKIKEENVKNKQVDVKHEVYAKTEAENLGVPEVCPEDFSAFFGGTYDEKISIFDDDVKFYEEYADLMANEG